ncbi:MAG: hypothetical protein IJ572_00935 [Bacilli bacterium]|nr:hypothetical protein [Bacilli bacterium]
MFINNDFNFDDFNNMPSASESKMDMNMSMNMDNQNCSLQGVMCPPVCEAPQERCCQRDIHHCIEHIVPINTRIINHHIYHHVYKPVYTCTEENICSTDSNCCM